MTKFEEKPEHINNVVIGIYIFRNSVLKYLSNSKNWICQFYKFTS